MELKPQDVVVAIALGVKGQNERERLTFRIMSDLTGLSIGEISNVYKRLGNLRLIGAVETTSAYRMNTAALAEFLCFGIRYYSYPKPLGYGRGIATGWNCAALQQKSLMLPRDTPLVWPVAGGDDVGEQISPLHDCAIKASSKDEKIYRLLALVDIMRLGTSRELEVARPLLAKELAELVR